MNVVQLILKNDPETLSHIENFTPDKVVLGDYFYSASRNFFKDDTFYSEEQIARILNLTDTEYADLIHRLIHNKVGPSVQPQNEQDEMRNKIAELEAKIKKSRDIEEGEKSLKEKESRLVALNNELNSVEEIQRRYQAAMQEYSQYSYLTRFNLTKMHSDLVLLIDQISRAEEDILNYKGEHIQNVKAEKHYDGGKLALAGGWTIALIIMCVILKLMETPTVIIITGGSIGMLLTLFFILTAKVEAEYPLMDESHSVSLQSRQRELEGLKAQKEAILRLVNMRSTDDFFHTKAKLGSCVKTLQYLQSQKERALAGKDYDALTKERIQLEAELDETKKIIGDGSQKLKSEEYLSTYREIDTLKLKLNQANQNKELDRPQIISKLASIRRELEVKLPGYKDLLKNSFKTSFNTIKQFLDDTAAKLSLPQFQINEEGDGYESLTDTQKILVDYAVVKNIYKKDFVFAVEYLSKKGDETISQFKDFARSEVSSDSKIYIVDEKTVY